MFFCVAGPGSPGVVPPWLGLGALGEGRGPSAAFPASAVDCEANRCLVSRETIQAHPGGARDPLWIPAAFLGRPPHSGPVSRETPAQARTEVCRLAGCRMAGCRAKVGRSSTPPASASASWPTPPGRFLSSLPQVLYTGYSQRYPQHLSPYSQDVRTLTMGCHGAARATEREQCLLRAIPSLITP